MTHSSTQLQPLHGRVAHFDQKINAYPLDRHSEVVEPHLLSSLMRRLSIFTSGMATETVLHNCAFESCSLVGRASTRVGTAQCITQECQTMFNSMGKCTTHAPPLRKKVADGARRRCKKSAQSLQTVTRQAQPPNESLVHYSFAKLCLISRCPYN